MNLKFTNSLSKIALLFSLLIGLNMYQANAQFQGPTGTSGGHPLPYIVNGTIDLVAPIDTFVNLMGTGSTGAITYLNSFGVDNTTVGIITILLDQGYSGSEPTNIHVGQNTATGGYLNMSAARPIVLKPNLGLSFTITTNSYSFGSTPIQSLFRFWGAQFFTVDGESVSGQRNLTFLVTNANTTYKVIDLVPTSGNGIQDVTLKNLNIVGSTSTTSINTSVGIYFGGVSGLAAAARSRNQDLSYINNYIIGVNNGIYHRGLVGTQNGGAQDKNVIITGNTIGDYVNTFSTGNLASIGGTPANNSGIYVCTIANSLIDNNTVRNCHPSSSNFRGIWLSSEGSSVSLDSNVRVTRNKIYSLMNTVVGSGCYGIKILSGGTANTWPLRLLVANNSISKIMSQGGTATASMIYTTGISVETNSANVGLEIFYNSINLFGDTLGANGMSACVSFSGGVTGGVTMMNNSFANTMGRMITNVSGYTIYGVIINSPTNPFYYSNFNNYFVTTYGGGNAFHATSSAGVRVFASIKNYLYFSRSDSNSYGAIPPFQLTDTILTVPSLSTKISHRTWNRAYALDKIWQFSSAIYNSIRFRVDVDINNTPRTAVGRFSSMGCHEWDGDSTYFNTPLLAVSGSSYTINGYSNPPTLASPTSGSFATLAEAVTYLNAYGVNGSGDVAIQFQNSYQGETGYVPAIIDYPGSVVGLNVKFTTTNTFNAVVSPPNRVNPSNSAILRLIGCQYVSFDGGINRNITFMYPALATTINSRVVAISPVDTATRDVSILNCRIIGNSNTTQPFTHIGIYVGNPIAPTNAAVALKNGINKINLSGNWIEAVRNGIRFMANASSDLCTIKSNIIGGTIAPGGALPTTYIGGSGNAVDQAGIFIKGMTNSFIDSNIVRNCVPNLTYSNGFRGIELDEIGGTGYISLTRNVSVTRNFIYNLVTNVGSVTNTTGTVTGLRINFAVMDTFRDLIVANNFIGGIIANGTNSAVGGSPNYPLSGIVLDAIGTNIGASTAYIPRALVLLHNTINMSGTNTAMIGTSGVNALYSTVGIRKGVSSINNIFGITMNAMNTAGGAIAKYPVNVGFPLSIFSYNTPFQSDSSNNNNYFATGSGTNYIGVNNNGTVPRTNIIGWRTFTNNSDAGSFSFPVVFLNDTTPNINLLSAGNWHQSAAFTGLLCNDIYGNPRLGCPGIQPIPLPSNRTVGAVEFGQPYAALSGSTSYQINGTENPPTYASPSSGSFGTIRSAINYLNGFGVDGGFGGLSPIKLVINPSAGYVGETDTFITPITVSDYPRANPNRLVWLTVASGQTVSVVFTKMPLSVPANSSLIRFNGSRYFGIDGSNSQTMTRDLTFTVPTVMNSNTHKIIDMIGGLTPISNTNPANIYNTIKNCNLIGNSTTSAINTFAAVYMGGALGTPSNPTLGGNNNNLIENNFIGGVQNGVYLRGTISRFTWDLNNSVNSNLIGGDNAPGYSLNTDYFGGANAAAGITATAQASLIINRNTIHNSFPNASNPRGIELNAIAGQNTLLDSAVIVTANKIYNIKSNLSGGAYGIYVGYANDVNNRDNNITLSNNMISGISSPGNATLMSNPYGIAVDAAATMNDASLNMYYNSVNLGTASTLTSGNSAALGISNFITGGISSLNNIFQNKLGSASGTNRAYAVMVGGINPFLVNDYNDYYVNAALSTNNNMASAVATVPVNYNTWQEIMSFTRLDTMSISYSVPFESDTTLDIPSGTPSSIYSYAKPLSIITDIYGSSRNTYQPTLGAHEYSSGTYTDFESPRIFNMTDPTLCVSGAAQLLIRIYDKNQNTDTLYYRVNGGTASSLQSISSNGVNRTYLIPPQLGSSVIEYRISARDYATFPAQPNVGVYPTNKPWDTLNTNVNVYPYTNGFEGTNNPVWVVQSLNNNALWVIGTFGSNSNPSLAARSGVRTAAFNASTMSNNSASRLVSPCFNFSTMTSPTLRFWVSQNSDLPNIRDSIAITVSPGGGFWSSPIKAILRVNPAYAFADWTMVEVCLGQYAGINGVRIGIEGYAKGNGNNILIDDIMVFDDVQNQAITPATFSTCFRPDSFNINIPSSDSRLLYRAQVTGVWNTIGLRMGIGSDLSLPIKTNKNVDTMYYNIIAYNPGSVTLGNYTCSYIMPTNMTTMVNRFYNGPFIVNGTPYTGSYNVGTPSLPDGAAVGSTLTYQLVPPAYYTNSDYGTKWAISSWSLKTPTGTSPAGTLTNVNPSSSAAGYIRLSPAAGDLDSTFALIVTFRLLETNCDSVCIRYIRIAPVPPTSFSVSNTTVCALTPILFTNTTLTSGNLFVTLPYTYMWNFGDTMPPIISTVVNPTKSFQYPGVFTVRLTVTNRFGLTSSVTQTITVLPAPIVSYTHTIPCSFDSTTFTPNSQPSGTTYAWKIWPSNTTLSTNGVFKYNFTKFDTAYRMTLIVTNSSGCANSFSKNLFVFAKPTAVFTTSGHCQGLNLPLNNTSSIASGNFGSYWDFGNGATGLSAQPVYKYPLSGNFTVKLRVTSAYGCSDSVSHTTTVYETPKPSFDATILCAGDSTIFDNKTVYTGGLDNINFLWTFGDFQSSTIQTPKHAFAAKGSYVVWLYATDKTPRACKDSITKTLTITQSPVASFNIPNPTSTTPPRHCVGSAITLINNSFTPDFSPFTCFWAFGNGQTTGDCYPTMIWTVPGTYDIALTVTSGLGGCQSNITKSITITPVPTITFNKATAPLLINVPPHLTHYTVNNIVTLTPSDLANAGNLYLWNFGDEDSSTSNKRVPLFTYNKKGVYKIRLAVTTPDGCVSNYTDTIQIWVGVGIDDVLASKFDLKAYPNPFGQKTTVGFTLNKSDDVKIVITDILGREVSSHSYGKLSIGKHELVLDESAFGSATATYLLNIQIGDEKIHKTLIKR